MRLVTRADFDGLVCGALITPMAEIDSCLGLTALILDRH